MMDAFDICHRTLPAYRHIFYAHDEDWIEFRTAFSYLDLAVPIEILSKKHIDKVLSKKRFDPFSRINPKLFRSYQGNVWRLKIETVKNDVIRRGRQFSTDDCVYRGCDRMRDFYSHALPKKRDRIGMQLFDSFCCKKIMRKRLEDQDGFYLEAGEPAVRFLNMATVFRVAEWRELGLNANFCRPIMDRVFWSIYPSILKGLYKMRHEHPLVVKKLWDLFCLTDETRINMFKGVPDAEHLQFMLEEANRARFDFWGMRYGGRKLTEYIVPFYVKKKRFECVELLLQYGFELDKGTPNKAYAVQRCNHPLIGSYLKFDWSKPIPNKFLVWFLATHYAMDVELVKLPQFVRLYQKLYRSLPVPPDPTSVVESYLTRVCEYAYVNERTVVGPFDGSTQSLIRDLMEAYVNCSPHPNENSGLTPRQLSHQSRCFIRDRLRANYQLPTAIDHSTLPSHIKEFLHLEF